MVKTLAICGVLCLAAAAFARFHEARQPAPAHAFATDAQRLSVRHAAFDEPAVAPSSNDGDAGRQAAAAQGADKPAVIALGVAHAGWSVLFSH
ncbi:hypothetical protein [Burkholderia sp. BCC1047]|uniref:hypothetical protein n=1 Tax=Burkholderia sp. BCC1047 TaxID=2676299 RepID=UPI00158B3A0E|nr:hypothetical protein [Burkholderia sp. BCC1047]